MADLELKPCPFCGAKPVMHEKKWRGMVWYSVRCENASLRGGMLMGCVIRPGSTGYKTAKEAAEAWNSRMK